MTATIADSILNEDPYPTRALILDGTSPAYAIPNLEKQEAAFEKLNFIVSFDVFMGESTLWADIVLPSITYLETWDVAHNYGAPETLGLRQPVIDSLGESCLTANTLVELARRLQLDYFDFTYRDYVAEGVKAWGSTLAEMEAVGYARRTVEVGRTLEDGLGTSSNKIELYAMVLANSGLNGLPMYERPSGHTPEIATEYPLYLIPPKLNVHTQSRTAGNPYLHELVGENWVEMNGETAVSLNISDGDLVWVESRQGRIRLKAKVGPMIHPRAVAIPHHFGHTVYNDLAQGKGVRELTPIALLCWIGIK